MRNGGTSQPSGWQHWQALRCGAASGADRATTRLTITQRQKSNAQRVQARYSKTSHRRKVRG